MRIALPCIPQASRISPRDRAWAQIALVSAPSCFAVAKSVTNSIASMAPMPRMSHIRYGAARAPISASRARKCAPSAVERASSPSASIASMAASAAAQATGLPP